jgi:hypothetical protein
LTSSFRPLICKRKKEREREREERICLSVCLLSLLVVDRRRRKTTDEEEEEEKNLLVFSSLSLNFCFREKHRRVFIIERMIDIIINRRQN